MRFVIIILISAIIAPFSQASEPLLAKKDIQGEKYVAILINILLSSINREERIEAAIALRVVDLGKSHPEIIPALIQALYKDFESVRYHAAASLGKIRPITESTEKAIEEAAANDPSESVRTTARIQLRRWILEPRPRPSKPPDIETAEPPLADR